MLSRAGASVLVAGLLGVAGLAGCAAMTSGTTTDRLSDGRYELKCQGPLSRCLDRADELCQGTRYRVLQASDDRDYVGPTGYMEREIRTSHAVIRCGNRGKSLFASGEKDAAEKPGESDTARADATQGHPACVPGGTQSCVGPAACAGGQACLPDGSGFSRCDCGAPKAESVAPPTVAAPPAVPVSPPPTQSSSQSPSSSPTPPAPSRSP